MRLNSRRAKQLGLIIGVFAILVGLQVWHGTSSARKEFEKTRAELVAHGAKLTPAQLEPNHYTTNGNGGPLFFEAAARIIDPPTRFRPDGMIIHWADSRATAMSQTNWRSLIPVGEALATTKFPSLPYNGWNNIWVEDKWTEIESFVESNRDYEESLRQVVTNRFITPRYETTNDIHSYVSNLAACKGAFNLSRSTILFDLSRGNSRQAMAHLTDASTAVVKLGDDNRMLTHLIRVACGTLLIEPLWEALQHDDWTDAELAALQKQWEAMDFSGPAVPAFESERAHALEQWKLHQQDMSLFWDTHFKTNLPTAEDMFHLAITEVFSRPSQALIYLGDSLAIASWENQTSFSDGKWYLLNSQKDLDALRTRNRSLCWITTAGLYSHVPGVRSGIPVSFLFSQTWFPSFSIHVNRMIAMDARREIAVTAIALERYRLRHSEYPASLADLVPATLKSEPRDWMASGTPLQYERTLDGRYRLWSVGDNGVDDGGSYVPTSATRAGGVSHFLGWDRALDWVWPIPMLPADTENVVSKLREEWRARTSP